jgi:hypothetical protein
MSFRSSLALVATLALSGVALPGAAMAATATTPAVTTPAPATASCPGTFQVLDNDRIGTLKLPAGPYTITTSGTVTCGRAATLFNRFLQDWGGVLPSGWKVKGSGFAQGSNGFSVKRSSTPPTPAPPNGQTCAGSFTLTSPDRILNMPLPAGNYSVQLLKQGGSLTCAAATRQFSTFLDATYTTSLPSPWALDASNATFSRGGGIGFRVVNMGGGTGGGGKTQGSQCPGTFQVLHDDQINSLKVPAGNYSVYAIGNLSCRQVMNDFRLDLRNNAIPAKNWTLNTQTATFLFLKTKGFRVEPVNGI